MVKVTIEVVEDGKKQERFELEGVGAIAYAFRDDTHHGGVVGEVDSIDIANMLLNMHSQHSEAVMAALRAFDDYIDNMGGNYANEVKEDEPNA